MRFSTRAGYGLRAAVNLAKNYPQQKNLQEISKEEGISLKYLEQLFRALKKNKLVISQKGREGGYTLSKNPEKIKVGEIIEILEGPIVPMNCAEGVCSTKCSCASSIVWTKLQTQIKKTLYSIKLKDLVN
jgi:Rrf2 family transcriptional regulator, cysteine metabolism repressor